MRNYKVVTTGEFDDWVNSLQDKMRVIIKARLDMISIGHFGDHKRFEGLIELRWANGNRVYAFHWGNALVVALYGGNKNAQDRDIKKSKKIRDEILEGSRPIRK